MLRTLIPAISGVFALVDWAAVGLRRRGLEWVCKPAVMAFLIWAALLLSPEQGSQRAWFVAALAFSLAGDVFLMLPPDGKFVQGLGSFLVAHLCYVVGFTLEPGGLSLAARQLAVGEVMLLLAAAPVGWRIVSSLRGSRLQGPVIAYMLAISAMVAAALGARDWVAVLGALFFYASDAMIGWSRFVQPWRTAKVWIIVTYHVAQFLLVWSLVR